MERLDTARWSLFRQDDNGHVFLMSTWPSRAEAEAARAAFEARGHKQMYWVSPGEPAG